MNTSTSSDANGAAEGPLRTLHILFLASICLCFLSEFRPVLIEVLKYGCAELVGVALIEGFIRGLFGGRGPMRFWRTARFAFSAWIVLTATHRDWIYVAKLALANHAIGRLLFAISSVWADWECRKTTETASTGST